MKSAGSSLLDKMQKVSGQCETHGPFEALMLLGRRPTCPACVKEQQDKEAIVRVREMEQARRLATVQAAVYRSGVPDRFRSKTFDDYVAECDDSRRALRICQRYAERFDERYEAGGGLVMCGLPGTGKTHLATSICNHITAQGRTALFAGVISVVRRIKETYSGRGETEREAIQHFVAPDLLVLDEVGVQFGSHAETIYLTEIINERYERVRPTILISNLPEADLSEFVGPRIMDRMHEGGGVFLAFNWKSKRPAIKTASRDMPAWATL